MRAVSAFYDHEAGTYIEKNANFIVVSSNFCPNCYAFVCFVLSRALGSPVLLAD